MDMYSAPHEAAVRYVRRYTLHPSQAETASGSSAPVDVSNFAEALLFITVTAVSGTTPSMQLALQTQDPVTGNWVNVPNINPALPSSITAPTTGTNVYALTNYGQQLRLSWTISGTSPSFTFTAGLVCKS